MDYEAFRILHPDWLFSGAVCSQLMLHPLLGIPHEVSMACITAQRGSTHICVIADTLQQAWDEITSQVMQC